MTAIFQLIREFKFVEVVRELTKDNVNDRENMIFTLNFNGNQTPCRANNVNVLEALCFMNFILSLTSASQQQLKDRVNILKNCIKAVYSKMQNYNNSIWDGRDDNNNSTAIWLAWGGASEELKDLLNKYPELIEEEKKLPRNVFDVAMEVGHLNICSIIS